MQRMKNYYLTEEETRALTFLAEERSNAFIRRECKVDTLFRASYDRMCRFLFLIRKKTGMEKTTGEAARKYLEAYASAKHAPTPQQIEALCRFAGHGHDEHERNQIGAAMRLAPTYDEAKPLGEALLDSALHEVGIFATDKGERRTQAKLWAARHCPLSTMPKLSPSHLEILQLHADGWSNDAIAEKMGMTPRNVMFTLREACLRVGATARGRGVQRRILQAILEHRRAQESTPVTMDDPAF